MAAGTFFENYISRSFFPNFTKTEAGSGWILNLESWIFLHLQRFTMGMFVMLGVKTGQQPLPCQSPVALLWVL